ncbi:hypothetical protein M758_8G058600 [Ceratodon purpureus]|nr:hypothetical protein M758_8G058600 [Ceratodon purpureus]
MLHLPQCRSFHLTLAIILSSSMTCFTIADQSSPIRGIDPRDLAHYQGETIWCKDGSKSFPRERLNDNFCDCADGTDEPGTSACPNGKFYCQNIGSAPKLVYASRVNDGICDCCDGSDEYERRVDCANTCGGAIKELSGMLEDDLGQSTNLDTDDDFEAIPDQQQKMFEMKAVMLVMQWLPLFSLLSLLGWMWARVRRRPQFRRKKVLRPSLV